MRGFRGRCARIGLGALAMILALTLASCAPQPRRSWAPPSSEPVAGVVLATTVETAEDATEPVAVPSVAPDPATLGLLPLRLRNDALALAARFVYVPGAPAFNDWVNTLIWNEIAASGGSYVPQVHPLEAGLSARGCLPGSGSWPAAEVLARPETGPVGGVGTAITCDITAAFGELLEVRVRTVVGTADEVLRDEVELRYVNVVDGGVFEVPARWAESAAGELWAATVELLRQQAGALSTAPIAPPDEAQLALVSAALESSRNVLGGGLLVTMPAGFASPELEGLAAAPTTEPFDLLVDAAFAQRLVSEQFRQLRDGLGAPFVGIATPAQTVPINCALMPCIALTYDDGPSDYTLLLLDSLAALQARATFFMVGGFAVNRPETVWRVAAEGHELASHTMNHPDLTTLSPETARTQVLDAGAVLTSITGQPNTMYRPPFGAINNALVREIGLPAILWSIDTNDWRKPGQPALFERVVPVAQAGDIVLFHDTHLDSVEVADDIILGLRDRGFEPVTVTELFGGSVPVGRVSRA